jgi:glutamine amidotransferase
MSAAAPRIAIVDYGMGNRRSVEKALERTGARVELSSDHETLARADGLVVPGVGAFPKAMENLGRLGLDDVIAERARAGTPVLGLCLGMQLLFDSSTELGGAPGLGLIAGEVLPLAADGLKLPHIGWSDVRFTQPSPLTAGLPGEEAFYHVHSLAPVPVRPEDLLGEAEYGHPFASAVQDGHLFGVQFHPEKSSAAGLRMLANFVSVCARERRPAAAKGLSDGP